MANHRYLHLVFIGLLLSLFLGVGCKRDKCKRVTCVNGTCLEGTCNCAEGYYTDDCSVVINAGLDATWSLEENCTAGADHYALGIAAAPGSMTRIVATGLWEKSIPVTLQIGADGRAITIDRQVLGQVEIAGSGTFNDRRDEFDLNYQIFHTGAAQAFDACSATVAKN